VHAVLIRVCNVCKCARFRAYMHASEGERGCTHRHKHVFCSLTWKGSVLPACSPPLMTLKQGTGMRIKSASSAPVLVPPSASAPPTSRAILPRQWSMCRYNGTPRVCAPARHTAREAPKIALAPRFDLLL
jgi:hypothetical protein